jgi:uncharacterized protein (DUF2384 family)
MTALISSAEEVFGDQSSAFSWLDMTLWELDNVSPREIVTRDGKLGLARARHVLTRIEYGVYT